MSLASSVVKIDPEILGGTPCFAGTRVPIKTQPFQGQIIFPSLMTRAVATCR